MSVVGVLNGDGADDNDDAIVRCMVYCRLLLLLLSTLSSLKAATAVLVTPNGIFGEWQAQIPCTLQCKMYNYRVKDEQEATESSSSSSSSHSLRFQF